jgi:hypothetical protein
MNQLPKLACWAVAAMAFCPPTTAFGQFLQVDLYRGISTFSGGGAPFSDPAGSFMAWEINFPADWDPIPVGDGGIFGADITGSIAVAASDFYTFTLDSDDGSLLFIDGTLAVDNGGPHGPNSVSNSVWLDEGIHPLHVLFYEAFGFPSELVLTLPEGVEYTETLPLPESSTNAAGLAAAALGLTYWRRRQARA